MWAHHVGAIAIHSWFARDMGTAYTGDGYVMVSVNGDAVETYFPTHRITPQVVQCDNIRNNVRVFEDGRMVVTAGEGHSITVVRCNRLCCEVTSYTYPLNITCSVDWCNGLWYLTIGGFVVVWGE